MRGFMILCFVAVAFAAPQYNYQQNGAVAGGVQQQQQQQYTGSQGGFGQATGAAPTFVAAQQQQQHQPQVQAIYNKQFFIHSAPEDDALEGSSSNDESSTLRKNLRVVIVKAPENKGLTNAALQLAKSASEDKTAIYVLNKQTDLGELQNQLNQLQESNPNKPEVHFVKYKTPEEAEHAQHSIQAQYDSFGGPSQISDEGVAPVESFIGSVGSIDGGHAQGGFVGSASNNNYAVQNTYLPSQKRF